MPENKISSTFYLLLTTLVCLLLFNFLVPESVFNTYNIKKVDYLTPVVYKYEKQVKPKKKLVVKEKAVVKNTEIPISEGLIAIEDFSPNGLQFNQFLKALHYSKISSSNCRIAFYGDSFIEGDILTMDLRDSLQKYFGGEGVGFLPISSEVSMFRRSLPSESKGWEVSSMVSQPSKEELGIAGITFTPGEGAQLKLVLPKPIGGIELLYKNLGSEVKIESTCNKVSSSYNLDTSKTLTMLKLADGNNNIRQYCLNVPGNKDLKVYGLNIAKGKGVYLDNFSMRGNSGLGLNKISDSLYIQFQQLMDYKLIVLQFGLNTVQANTTDFSLYERNMTRMISRLKRLFPETSFLLISTSDRSYKENGSFVTMPSIPLLVESQKKIAEESGILFWNMYEGMGGENSMVTLVKDKKANKDYTHLTFSGGQFVADKLYKAIMYAFENYKYKENEKVRLAVR